MEQLFNKGGRGGHMQSGGFLIGVMLNYVIRSLFYYLMHHHAVMGIMHSNGVAS